MSRTKYFSGALPDHALELDEDGIPAIAYWNTKGDHPVKAEQVPHHHAYKVTYEDDDAAYFRSLGTNAPCEPPTAKPKASPTLDN